MSNDPVVLSKPLAWVTETFDDATGKTQFRVERDGMTRDEIIAHFPPDASAASRGNEYNRIALCRAIIYEAYQEVQNGAKRERNNIRGFWYERFMYTLRNIMADTASQNSLDNTINAAWGDLVEDGWLTYDDLNIYSEKENAYHIGVAEDSPYPTVIVLIEKEAFFDALYDLADIYEISFTAAGGQASRAAAMAYVKQLKKLGVDLAQPFTVFSMADFDPEGWDIPEQFIKHMQTGGVTGEIELVRLGVLKDQLGDTVDQFVAVYPLDARSESARKGKLTKWQNWAELTGGIMARDSDGELVPGRVELNIYTASQIRERIISGLCEHLDGFAFQVRAIREAVEAGYDDAHRQYMADLQDEIREIYEPYYEAIDSRIAAFIREREQRTTAERARIRELQDEIDRLDAVRIEKEKDIAEEQALLESAREKLNDEEVQQFYEVWEQARVNVDKPTLVGRIETNGGWQHFAEKMNIHGLLTEQDLRRFGQEKQPVAWSVMSYQHTINAWAYDNVLVTWPNPTGPDDDPESLIHSTLERAA